jgi:hypothetical protein
VKEITGNLWDYCGKIESVAIAITTNGFVKNNGECVMGRGCAKEATLKYPGISKVLGDMIKESGNHVHRIRDGVYSFPVKHNWWEEADVELIKRSCTEISNLAKESSIIIPRMGCGNGKLKWNDVREAVKNLLDDRFSIITFERRT